MSTPLIGAFLAGFIFGKHIGQIASFLLSYKIVDQNCGDALCALYMIACLELGGIKPCINLDETDETERKRKSSFFKLVLPFKSTSVRLLRLLFWFWIQMNVCWGWGFGVSASGPRLKGKLLPNSKPGGMSHYKDCQVIVLQFLRERVKVSSSCLINLVLYETLEEGKFQIPRSRQALNIPTNSSSSIRPGCENRKMDSIKGSNQVHGDSAQAQGPIIRLLPVWASGIVFSTLCTVKWSTKFVFARKYHCINTWVHISRFHSASLSALSITSASSSGSPLQTHGHWPRHYQLCPLITAGLLDGCPESTIVQKNIYYDLIAIPMSIIWWPSTAVLSHWGCAEGAILHYFYWLLAILSFLNFIFVSLISKWFYLQGKLQGILNETNSILCICNSNDSNSEASPPEGDTKQELLARISMLQAQKILANIEIEMQAFEESAELKRVEIERNDNKVADIEGQMEKDRYEGMFFKNLGQKAPVDKAKAKEGSTED
ncbi:hypothetical protein NC652_037213 [Populus alba x Populus x berolinensis]|nr:hypothetical protein NC652_037213 [Populus alba x Populus x berolinensis]